jgi:hypothetical protein
MKAKDLLLTPRPKHVEVREGHFLLPSKSCIMLIGEHAGELLMAAKRIKAATSLDWRGSDPDCELQPIMNATEINAASANFI